MVKYRYMSQGKYEQLSANGEIREDEIYIICEKEALEDKVKSLYEETKKIKEMIENYEEKENDR